MFEVKVVQRLCPGMLAGLGRIPTVWWDINMKFLAP